MLHCFFASLVAKLSIFTTEKRHSRETPPSNVATTFLVENSIRDASLKQTLLRVWVAPTSAVCTKDLSFPRVLLNGRWLDSSFSESSLALGWLTLRLGVSPSKCDKPRPACLRVASISDARFFSFFIMLTKMSWRTLRAENKAWQMKSHTVPLSPAL